VSGERERLSAGLDALGLALPAVALDRLLDYLDLLERWNRVHNLTAVRDREQMVARHLLDSLAVLPHVHGARLLDVGSGAGLPGIPLAVARPDLSVCLVDARVKRVAFLRHVRAKLGLSNVEPVHARIEDYRAERRFDTVIARAFSRIGNFLAAAGHLCADDGRVLAMKGTYPREELADLPSGWRLVEAVPLRVPSLDGQRHLMIFAAE
jgi:16S rRNA (guanine527-N7)-methyltransferase